MPCIAVGTAWLPQDCQGREVGEHCWSAVWPTTSAPIGVASANVAEKLGREHFAVVTETAVAERLTREHSGIAVTRKNFALPVAALYERLIMKHSVTVVGRLTKDAIGTVKRTGEHSALPVAAV